MLVQRTIKNPISVSGIGLHGGESVNLTLKPAAANSGIVFKRVDLPASNNTVRISPDSVTQTTMCTRIGSGDCSVATIEHLMSALAAMGIDNIEIELDKSEVPIMDGSAAPFIFIIKSAGIAEFAESTKRLIRINKSVRVQDEKTGNWAQLEPYVGWQLQFEIKFDHPAFRETELRYGFEFSSSRFTHQIARCRTFGFYKQVEELHSKGLALGAGFSNAVVLSDTAVMNEDGLRCTNEFVKHKVLDALGDLYVFPHPMMGRYTGFKAGHALNNQLIRTLHDDQNAWDYVEGMGFEERFEPARFQLL